MFESKLPNLQHDKISIKAKGYLDTVSEIRGNYGRDALREDEKIYFMKKEK